MNEWKSLEWSVMFWISIMISSLKLKAKRARTPVFSVWLKLKKLGPLTSQVEFHPAM